MMGMSRRETSVAATATTTGPLVPEFGETAKTTPVVLKFGDYEQSVVTSGVSSATSQDAILQQQINEQAQQLLTRYDKDKNGTIEKSTDEWKNIQIDTDTTDVNRDNRITLDELKVYVGSQLRGGRAGAKVFTAFGTAYEHMPEGIPSWFTERDKDNDGQLTMFEYANNQPITENMVGEFEWLDLNNDGIATLAECYSAIKTKEELENKNREQEGGGPQGGDNRRSRARGGNESGSFTPGADQERDGGNRERGPGGRGGSMGGNSTGGGPMGNRPEGGRGNWGGDNRGPRGGGDNSQWQGGPGGRGNRGPRGDQSN